MPEPSSPPSPSVQRPWLILALILWAVLTLGHGTGLDVVTLLVEWARTPGTISESGGQIGFLRGERILAMLVGLLFLGMLGFIVRRAVSFGVRALVAASPPWFLCAGLAWLCWRIVIVYTTELVHFAQYALIGALLTVALDKGRRPQLSFVVAVGLGFVDELWQHYGLHVWRLGESTHYLDWSDPFLNGVGAFAGVLPAVTWLRLRGDGFSQAGVVYKAALIAALPLPLVLLDPVTLAAWFGSYPYYPFWDEHTNLKAVHWVTPYEGIPLFPAFLLVVGAVLDPVRRTPSVAVLAAATVLVGLAIQPVSRQRGTAVHEVVPQTMVSLIDDADILIDGHADEAAWSDAPRLGPFVHNTDAADRYALCPGTPILPATHARILWSSAALYILVETEDVDIWARDLARDAGGVLGDEGVRLLIDDGGEEVLFHEINISPANAIADLLQLMGGAPLDFNPWAPALGYIRFDANEISTAVVVDGSLEIVSSQFSPVVTDVDVGYHVEVRIPWEVFRTTSTPSDNTVHTTLPPQVGHRWRLGLYRRETPRPQQALQERVDVPSARQRLGLSVDDWQSLAAERLWDTGDGMVTGVGLWQEVVHRCGGLQAWSPTYKDLRQPARFGVIEFSE